MSSLTPGPWTVEEKKADYQTDEGDKYHTIEYIIRGIDQSSSQYIARVNRKEDAVAIVSVLELIEAGKLRRNVVITDGVHEMEFRNTWIAVPKEDFDKLRAAVRKAGGKV